MRDHYPYCQPSNAFMISLPEETFAKIGDVVVVVELTDERKEVTKTEYPNPSVDPNLTTEVTTYFFPAKVLRILDIRDSCSLIEEDITLSFPGLLYDPNITFEEGQRIVVMGVLKESSGQVLLSIGPNMSFYLTDEEYIMSLSNNKYMDRYSGLKLDAFEKEMFRITKAGGWHQQ